MKKFLLICCMLLFLCSCTQGPVTEDNIPPNNSYEKDSASADAEEINITSMLSLQQDQSYVVCDYFEGNVLILISDSSKQNSNDITDQATTVFFEEFVVLNISRTKPAACGLAVAPTRLHSSSASRAERSLSQLMIRS